MTDFTSALYLGMLHPSASLRPWVRMTTGVPAALGTPDPNSRVERRLARLVGAECAALSPSTLHLFIDLFGIMGGDGASIYLDGGAYPVIRWGAERAAARGARFSIFPHHDVAALRRALRSGAHDGARPVVAADGFCIDCGRPAPVADYLSAVREFGGVLVLDDTQALGLLGCGPGPSRPYGRGGGGILRWSGAAGPDIVLASSLSKGFGVPVAMMASGRGFARRFRDKSDTRVHCSPPSAAAVSAAHSALRQNESMGERLRQRTAASVGLFKRRMAGLGLETKGGLFPVQTITDMPGGDPVTLHHLLRRMGVNTILRRGRRGSRPCISFIITAMHRRKDIEEAAAIMKAVLGKSARNKMVFSY